MAVARGSAHIRDASEDNTVPTRSRSSQELRCALVDFFFQAEDGIRDIGVTGVQTCALPIWSHRPTSLILGVVLVGRWLPVGTGTGGDMLAQSVLRSEERRVGKEYRWRWRVGQLI